jgi:hypothetical protein
VTRTHGATSCSCDLSQVESRTPLNDCSGDDWRPAVVLQMQLARAGPGGWCCCFDCCCDCSVCSGGCCCYCCHSVCWLVSESPFAETWLVEVEGYVQRSTRRQT